METSHKAEIAVIGGTGIYDSTILEDVKEVKVPTPYGSTSDLITLGIFKDRYIAFLPRHGKGHVSPPHNLNNRANIWAIKQLGAKRIVASSAVGSLREDYRPGDFVITDQFIDRTRKRVDTFYQGGQLCHISSADPICPQLHDFFSGFVKELGFTVHQNGTYVCIEGPRFSTRAESRLFRQWGCDIVGMTLYPECILAREAEICYVTLSFITDYDVWHEEEEPVTLEMILQNLGENTKNAKKILKKAIAVMPENIGSQCGCQNALENTIVTKPEVISSETKNKLRYIVGRYLSN